MADDGGIGRLQRRMRAIPEAVRKAAQPALVKQAEAMAGTMRTLVPVQSGDLKDSIAVTAPGGTTPAYSQPGGQTTLSSLTAAVTVGDHDVRYGHLVEYGHSNAPPKPFFWPAARMHNKKAKAAIKRAVSKAVRGSWGGP